MARRADSCRNQASSSMTMCRAPARSPPARAHEGAARCGFRSCLHTCRIYLSGRTRMLRRMPIATPAPEPRSCLLVSAVASAAKDAPSFLASFLCALHASSTHTHAPLSVTHSLSLTHSSLLTFSASWRPARPIRGCRTPAWWQSSPTRRAARIRRRRVHRSSRSPSCSTFR